MTLQQVHDTRQADKLITDLQDPVVQLTKRVEQLEANEGVAPVTPYYPSRATLWHDESLVVTGNAISKSLQTAQYYNIASMQSIAANGDTFTTGFMLKAGTYSFGALGIQHTDRGLIDWYIDNVKVVSLQDWYGATTYNTEKTASVTVVGNGYHVLKGIVNGKNASSSGYYIQLTKMYFRPATDAEDHT